MNRIVLLLCCTILLSVESYAQSIEEKQIVRARPQLEAAMVWFIEEGVSLYFREGDQAVRNNSREEYAVSTSPHIENDRHIARTILGWGLIQEGVVKVYGEIINETLYEYWIIKLSAKNLPRECEFIITKARDFQANRTFIQRSDIFSTEIVIDSNVSFSLPIEDTTVLQNLQAWTEPGCFTGSDISNFRVDVDDDGNFYKKRISLWELFLFKISGIRG